MSGYDIKKLVEMGLSHFWNENYGNLYPTLESLVETGLATRQADPDSGKRKRNIYQITEAGHLAFQEWLSRPTDPPAIRNELQLKFFLSSTQPKKVSLRIVREYRVQQQALLAEYQQSAALLRRAIDAGEYPEEVEEILGQHAARRSASHKAKQYKVFLLSLRHGILAIQARITWCDEVLSELSTK